ENIAHGSPRRPGSRGVTISARPERRKSRRPANHGGGNRSHRRRMAKPARRLDAPAEMVKIMTGQQKTVDDDRQQRDGAASPGLSKPAPHALFHPLRAESATGTL